MAICDNDTFEIELPWPLVIAVMTIMLMVLYKKRRNMFDYRGCLAHAKVTTIMSTRQILCVLGYFEHNEGCWKAAIVRISELPIHPSVYVIGSSITEVQTKKSEIIPSTHIQGSTPTQDLAKSNYQWLLQQKDFHTLYKKFNRLLGIDVKKNTTCQH